MAAVLFGSRSGLVVLPLMLYHQLQLMVCAGLAGRWSRSGTRRTLAGPASAPATGGQSGRSALL
jgi:sodium/bile acid cotransporter 7